MVRALATIPVASPAGAPALAEETGAMILRYAIVGGALELLPQTMATLAIIPLQSKMVADAPCEERWPRVAKRSTT